MHTNFTSKHGSYALLVLKTKNQFTVYLHFNFHQVRYVYPHHTQNPVELIKKHVNVARYCTFSLLLFAIFQTYPAVLL